MTTPFHPTPTEVENLYAASLVILHALITSRADSSIQVAEMPEQAVRTAKLLNAAVLNSFQEN